MAKNVKKSDYASDKNSNVEIKKTRFERELIKSSKEIQEGKATLLAKQVEAAFITKLIAAETKVNNLRLELLAKEDISRTNSLDLNVVKPGFDASNWVESLYSLKIRLAEAEEELSILQELIEEWL